MNDSDISIRRYDGQVFVESDADSADMRHRWWFNVTDANRLVFGMEVVEDNGVDGVDAVRHTVPRDEMEVPTRVRDALLAKGFESVVDLDGSPL